MSRSASWPGAATQTSLPVWLGVRVQGPGYKPITISRTINNICMSDY